MLKRVISALIGIPFLIGIVTVGNLALFLGVVIVALIGLHEFYNAMHNKGFSPVQWVGYIFSLSLLTIFYFFLSPQLSLFIIVLAIFVLNVILLFQPKYTFLDIAVTIYGILYVTLFLGHIVLIDRQPNNIILWLTFITAWATDTFAYFTGYFLGKTKLCPSISPKKTVEGSIGGIVGSTVMSGIFAYFFLKEFIFVILLIGFIGSIVAQLGDLTASAIKRYVGIKDFGNIMPGHGGVLDRFDSILFTAPIVYYALLFLINK